MSKQTYYSVGLHKYYCKEQHHPDSLGEEFAEVVTVLAPNRTSAAKKAWDIHGERWKSWIKDKTASIGRVSLFVNEPKAGVGGKIGRLNPIEVYQY